MERGGEVALAPGVGGEGEKGEDRRLGRAYCDVQMGAAGRVLALPLELKREGYCLCRCDPKGAASVAVKGLKGEESWRLSAKSCEPGRPHYLCSKPRARL